MTAILQTRIAAPSSHPQQLDFTPEQHQQIHAATARMLRGVVADQQATVALAEETASRLVSGTFVSLKRGKHLRGCCGGLLERPAPLRETLSDAVTRTALEDVRFPPVSPTELPYLDLEVWLLFNPQPIHVRGEERAAVVITGGKHGLIVRSGQSRGLLLPGVALEHDWDARTFLEQVCLKAGVHPSRWKDDDTVLSTFEGASIRGPVLNGEEAGATPAPFLSREQVAAYAAFSRNNLAAMLIGAATPYTFAGAPDGNVSGLVLTVAHLGDPEPLQMGHIPFPLRPSVALQGMLFQLTRQAAQALAARGLSDADAATLSVGITVLYNPAMHGSAAEPDLRGVDGCRRAILVVERSRSGLILDSGRTAAETLAEAAARVEVSDPGMTSVFSLEVDTTEERLVLSTMPRPVAGPAVRPPAVAGTFYERDPAVLARMVDEMLGSTRGAEVWPAAMVPHAGLRFSGRIAAAVLRRLAIPRTILVLGPKHTTLGMEWAVAPHEQWSLPGATIASDPELAQELARAIPGLALDAAAHQQEHAIEVELPLLARLAPHSRVVGIAIGHAGMDGCRRFADGLAEVLGRREERPLLLISSDMNHFASDAENRRLDELALAALDRLDPVELYQTVRRHHITMCGMLPAVIVLETLRRLGGLKTAERVGYATTADVTGDPSRVVGYAGMLFA
ncbi:MAG TPA: AmmeMemoRadiSam system protein B [Gemmataceae bacterium]|nr:AmmeMemoRadiSam system protein B [Gemmataceae bacterium]